MGVRGCDGVDALFEVAVSESLQRFFGLEDCVCEVEEFFGGAFAVFVDLFEGALIVLECVDGPEYG